MTTEELTSLEQTIIEETDPFTNTASVAIETKKEEVIVEKPELTIEEKLARIEKNYSKLLEDHRRLQTLTMEQAVEITKLKGLLMRGQRLTGTEHVTRPIKPVPPATQQIREAATPIVKVDITAEAQKTLPDITNDPNGWGSCPHHGDKVRANVWKKCKICGDIAAKQAWADNYRR